MSCQVKSLGQGPVFLVRTSASGRLLRSTVQIINIPPLFYSLAGGKHLSEVRPMGARGRWAREFPGVPLPTKLPYMLRILWAIRSPVGRDPL